MEVEFRVNSDHFSWDDVAFPEAIEKYTSLFWPFGREGRARNKLEEKQEELLAKHGIKEESHMGITTLVVNGVETEEEAESKMEDLKKDIEAYYQQEFAIEEPFEYSQRDKSKMASR